MKNTIDLKTSSFLLGILSIIFAFLSPFAGAVMGIIGIVQAHNANYKRSMILNIVGVALSVIIGVISVVIALKYGGLTSFPSV